MRPGIMPAPCCGSSRVLPEASTAPHTRHLSTQPQLQAPTWCAELRLVTVVVSDLVSAVLCWWVHSQPPQATSSRPITTTFVPLDSTRATTLFFFLRAAVGRQAAGCGGRRAELLRLARMA